MLYNDQINVSEGVSSGRGGAVAAYSKNQAKRQRFTVSPLLQIAGRWSGLWRQIALGGKEMRAEEPSGRFESICHSALLIIVLTCLYPQLFHLKTINSGLHNTEVSKSNSEAEYSIAWLQCQYAPTPLREIALFILAWISLPPILFPTQSAILLIASL